MSAPTPLTIERAWNNARCFACEEKSPDGFFYSVRLADTAPGSVTVEVCPECLEAHFCDELDLAELIRDADEDEDSDADGEEDEG